MSRCYQGSTTVSLDHQGVDVLVRVEYEVDIDDHYGADADGHRGVRRVEVQVLNKYVEAPVDGPWGGEEVQDILAHAEEKFLQTHMWK